MSNYLPSNKVKVFPFGNERIHDPLSRTLNESNIARLVRFLTGNRDYVLSYHEDNNLVDFVLNGYTFSIDLSDNELYVDDNTKDIYAAITISGYDNRYPLLDGNDDGVFNFEVTEQGQAVEVPRGLSVTTITSPTQFTYHFTDENALLKKLQYYVENSFEIEHEVKEQYDKFFYTKENIRAKLVEEIDKACLENKT